MIIGHEKNIKLLNKVLVSNNKSQAFIFSGPEAVGKFLVAQVFGRSLIEGENYFINLQDNNLLRSSTSRTGSRTPIADNSISFHPDLLILSPEKETKKNVVKEKDIKIEAVRDKEKELALYPYQGKYRVLIINDAHRLTVASQNALLKILEEPNKTSVIILVTHEDSKLLPTIHSRCQKIKFNLVPDNVIKESLKLNNQKLYLGRPGLAIKFQEDKINSLLYEEAYRSLKNLKNMNLSERISLADDFSKNIPETIKKLEFWMWVIHEKALVYPKLFLIIERINESLKWLKTTNANSKLVLENLLINL